MLINSALLSGNKPSTDAGGTPQPHRFHIFLTGGRLDLEPLGLCGATAEGCWVMAKRQGSAVKAGAVEGQNQLWFLWVGAAWRGCVGGCCRSACDGWWEAPRLWELLLSRGAWLLQAPGAITHLLLRPPWVSQCCNPSASARPRPVNS